MMFSDPAQPLSRSLECQLRRWRKRSKLITTPTGVQQVEDLEGDQAIVGGCHFDSPLKHWMFPHTHTKITDQSLCIVMPGALALWAWRRGVQLVRLTSATL